MYVPQLEALLREAGHLPPLIGAMVRLRTARALDPLSPQTELATGRPLPAAALTRLLDRPDDAQGIWMRADPVGLVPDLAAVWLQPERAFEPGAWSEELAGVLDEEGLSLELTPQGRGYIRLARLPESRFAPPWTLGGSSLEHCLPEGADAQSWRRLLNEIQVILHQHRQGAKDPAPVPGSLWFWGAGSLPEPGSIEPRVQRIVGTDPQLLGLAQWLELPQRDFETDAEPRAGSLIEWSSRFEDSADANLERLQTFLRPSWRRLRMGLVRELELAGIETVRSFSVADAWRVWR